MTKHRLLICEDERLIAMDLATRLTALGYRVVAHAASGEDAVRLAAELKPDLVLMDIVLGTGLDGIAAAERIHRQRDVPIIYLTAYSDDAVLTRAKATEPYGYLVKPFTTPDLSAAIEVALAKHRMETERRRIERQLAETQKLEAVGKLAGGLAHHLNNLLTSVVSGSELALMQLPPGNPARPDIERVMKAGDAAGALIQELLTFCRRQSLTPRLLDLRAYLTERVPMVQALLPDTIRLDLGLAPDPCPVHIDPSQLDLILIHLAQNACEAMTEGGTLTIGTCLFSGNKPEDLPNGFAPCPYVLLLIRDTGCGMTADVVNQCFDPFFSTKESRHLVAKTPGLGLSAVWGAVRRSHGVIQVISAPGEGTTFTIWLPLVVPPVPDAPAEG